ncbi:hypothetical protein EFP47_00850 [Lactiplantibacillus pentosus]|uniref:hypothetical protein n=1 Tax=Lactiplantibacillus pentosus TaxID=1589 RepID=UPI0021A58E70|nr:hypothetical protein [Lactiplantibacillus pentosus]MCT3308245.1 hypothetical protein [Lactiplantibacillus pentosus]
MKRQRILPALIILGICGGLVVTPATNAQALRVRGTRITRVKRHVRHHHPRRHSHHARHRR